MAIETVHKLIQDWTNNVPLVILGSGASVPYGLPTMYALGEYIKSSIIFDAGDDRDNFAQFIAKLDDVQDLERALDEVHVTRNVLNEIIKSTWVLVSKHDSIAFDTILVKPEEFGLAKLVKYLISTSERRVSIITTNYDRLAEYAASLANGFICNGFAQGYMGQFSSLIHSTNFSGVKGFNGQVNIWKVHGSLDWFKDSMDQDTQYPLRPTIPASYKSLIVTPGATKYLETQLEPFRTILTQSDSELESATGYLCIGYGFNDIHVQQKLIAQIKKGKPIIVITKMLSDKTKEAIIDHGCKAYILIEECNDNSTRIFSSHLDAPLVIPDKSYWQLNEYLKLII